MRIVVDGREYGSVEEMPPEVRKIYDQVRRSLRSMEEGAGPAETVEVKKVPGGAFIRTERTELELDGKPVDPAKLPPEAREAYERFLAGHGDLEGVAPGTVHPLGTQPSKPEVHTIRTVQEWRTGGRRSRALSPQWPLWANVLILAVCAAIIAAIFLAS